MERDAFRAYVFAVLDRHGPKKGKALLLDRLRRDPELRRAAEDYWLEIVATPRDV